MGKAKKKNLGKASKKILPKVSPSEESSRKRVLTGPPRAEFTPAPFVLVPCPKRNAPTFMGYGCSGAWEIKQSTEKKARFEELAAQIGPAQTLYHGTATRNITSIAQEGLKRGSSGMFGAGIYLGGPGKAFGYSHSWGAARYLIEVQAVLGKVLEAPSAIHYSLSKLQDLGFDSVSGVARKTLSWGGTLQHTEYVVYSSDQVLPVRVYEYQQTEAPPPDNGPCVVIVKSNVAIPAGQQAFADILSQKPCGKTAHTKLWLDGGGFIWVCNSCITNLKLKIGSKVQVQITKGQIYRSTLIQTVRIRGRY